MQCAQGQDLGHTVVEMLSKDKCKKNWNYFVITYQRKNRIRCLWLEIAF